MQGFSPHDRQFYPIWELLQSLGAAALIHCGTTAIGAGEPGGLATRASWAWINASWGNPEFYVRLRMRSMKEWRRLAEEIPDLKPRWVGGWTGGPPVSSQRKTNVPFGLHDHST